MHNATAADNRILKAKQNKKYNKKKIQLNKEGKCYKILFTIHNATAADNCQSKM